MKTKSSGKQITSVKISNDGKVQISHGGGIQWLNPDLVASAPELLDQCRNTLRQLEQVYIKGDPKTEGLCLSIRGLRGVIAKAEGR